MGFLSKWVSALAGTFSVLVFMASCEEDLDTLGDGVIGAEPFVTDVAEYDVFAYNAQATAVQTNRLPIYQLGVYNDPLFGTREAKITSQLTFTGLSGNPTFGTLTQETEDMEDPEGGEPNNIQEQETVTKVYLYIPYQLEGSDNDLDGVPDELDSDPDDADSDTDGDGVSDISETSVGSDPLDASVDGTEDDFIANNFARSFALDSIFLTSIENPTTPDLVGKSFNLKVERSSFFLRDLDPNANFEEAQEYFSTSDLTSFVEGAPLFDGVVTIDNSDTLVFFEDDLDTEDEDESLTVSERIPPGIRVPLDTAFFQENILDKEGDFELLTQSNFSDFIRGIHLSITPQEEDLMLLLDLTQANITITYTYKDYLSADSDDGDAGDTIDVETEYVLNLLQTVNNVTVGNAVNTYIDGPFNSEVTNRLGNSAMNSDRLVLRGGSGTYSELRLFNEDDAVANTLIEEIKANNWVINEANLVFYVDETTLDANAMGTFPKEPDQLYIFNADTNNELWDPVTTSGINLTNTLNIFGGTLETDDNGDQKYTVRITDYINNIIIRDSTLAPLRLTVSSNPLLSGVQEAMGNEGTVDLPVGAAVNPLGTILFGNNVPQNEEDKKLKLQILYTDPN